MNEREERIAREMDRCVYFNGLIHKTCDIGIVYTSIRDTEQSGLNAWPCFAESSCRTCDQRHIRTREEAIAEIEAADAREAAIPRDEQLGCKYEVQENGDRIALVIQRGYRCRHSGIEPSRADLKAAGYQGYRIVMFTDADKCPECLAKRGPR